MSLATALAVGLAGSLLSWTFAYVVWGPWGYRKLPGWADWPLLIAFLILNVAGWIVAVVSV